jgi:hypothetical protein
MDARASVKSEVLKVAVDVDVDKAKKVLLRVSDSNAKDEKSRALVCQALRMVSFALRLES